MSAGLYSFIDIFTKPIKNDDGEVQLNKIAIPRIQRDYAQGRQNEEVNRVRSRFLNALYDAVTDKPITLDFVYGDIDEDNTMTPLDGQQRLTTLFLLHWYAAKKENIPEEKYDFLKNFSYDTRYSARYFCDELVKFSPGFQYKLSEDIINQAWFPLSWCKDPTIRSMLVMLDAIAERFKDVPDIWGRLDSGAITFYFLAIKDMGLTDELYIKMNSRGKPLTQFEHFKAELERELRIMDEKNGTAAADRVISSIDRTWTDLLWRYRNGGAGDDQDNIIDDEFLLYFKFICNIICYRNGESPQSYSDDVFDLLQRYFSADNEKAPENIETLEAFFNCWCNIKDYANPASFLSSFMSFTHEPGKIRVFTKGRIDIFEDCIHPGLDKTGKLRKFLLNRVVLLYAITVYLQHQQSVSYADFIRRIRIIYNLIQNSENEISDRQERNRIPAIIKAVDSIILSGTIDLSIDSNFNVNQLQEEQEKIHLLENDAGLADSLFALEDHEMLKGQISIVGLENLNLVDNFESLFKCSLDKIDCALMTIGNYGQREVKKNRYQFASSELQEAWDSLFHRSGNIGFENTKSILVELLKTNTEFNDAILDSMVSNYISTCEAQGIYPWNYYYVKYPAFRPGRYGKMSNDDAENAPYMFSVMQTESKWSTNTYMPYLKEADDMHLSKEYLGQRLVYPDIYITCTNAAYIVHRNDDESVADVLEIAQNADGFDTEDRILKLRAYIDNNIQK